MKYVNIFVTIFFKSKSTLEFKDEHRSTFSFPGFQMVIFSSKNWREIIKNNKMVNKLTIKHH